MSLKNNIITIWKNKGQIIEGITNSIFKKEDVEEIAKHRMMICKICTHYTTDDSGCMVPGTTPCCNQILGGCGCSLEFKTRSLSSDCPMNLWEKVMEEHEEDLLKEKLGL